MTAPTELLGPEEVQRTRETLHRWRDALQTVLFGQERLIEDALICLLARGHLLLEGLPGLGKTELVKAMGGLLGLAQRRVQFTPDVLPTDITGTHILEEREDGRREAVFHEGPVFTQILLADEINRASPKTQSALLEAMQERSVSLLGVTRPLPTPFFVLATQNPIELEGTYPLPEAQLDRFTFKLDVAGVGAEVMTRIVSERPRGEAPRLHPLEGAPDLAEVFARVDRVHLPGAVAAWLGRLVAATDPTHPSSPEIVRRGVRFPASPRAAIALAETARAAALFAGKPNAGFEEVRRVAPAVLRHRLLLNYQARLEGLSPDDVIRQLLEETPELAREGKSR